MNNKIIEMHTEKKQPQASIGSRVVQREEQKKGISYWGAVWRRFKRNKMALFSGIFVVVLIILAAMAPIVAPYPYDETHYEHTFEGSSLCFLFGTDDLGRDMLSRILYSLRNALIVAFGAQTITLILGVLLGAIAG